MHEASIAIALIEVAREVLREHGGTRVTALTVRLGQWSSVLPEALSAAFPAAAAGTPLEGAHLSIVRVPGVGECPEHGPVTLELFKGLRCPVCGLPTPRLLEGDELELDEVEIAPPVRAPELLRTMPPLTGEDFAARRRALGDPRETRQDSKLNLSNIAEEEQ